MTKFTELVYPSEDGEKLVAVDAVDLDEEDVPVSQTPEPDDTGVEEDGEVG